MPSGRVEHEEKSLQHSNLYFKLNVPVRQFGVEVNKGENERENGFFLQMHNYLRKSLFSAYRQSNFSRHNSGVIPVVVVVLHYQCALRNFLIKLFQGNFHGNFIIIFGLQNSTNWKANFENDFKFQNWIKLFRVVVYRKFGPLT